MTSFASRINIAIDGPAGAGKSTVARKAANALRYIYVDTGAMYRAVTQKVLDEGLSITDEEAIGQLANRLDIQLRPGREAQLVLVDGEDLSEQIRSLAVNRNVSHVARIAAVRARMSELQRQMAESKGVVMDGRDIGTHVLPDAELKVYLTATPTERARRRFNELAPDAGITLSQLEQEIIERDRLDEEREIAPLRRAADARLIDSTGRSIEDIVAEIVDAVHAIARTISAEEK